MALSINREIGIRPQGNVFVPNPSDTVKGDELTRVAREILFSNPRKTSVNAAEVKIFTQGADVNTVRQTATNIAGFDVNISENAQQAINGLKALAAQNQVQNLSKVVDGKIHINSEKTDFSENKSIFNNSGQNGIYVSESATTDKDRKGPGGFYMPFEKEEEETKKGINLVI